MTMFSLQRSFSLACAGLLVTSAFSAAASADDVEAVIHLKAQPAKVQLVNAQSEGVVHVRSTPRTAVIVRGQSPQETVPQVTVPQETVRPVNGEYFESQNCPQQNCPQQEVYSEDCNNGCRDYLFDRLMMRVCSRVAPVGYCLQYKLQNDCRETCAWARGKFGYFIPSGSCGQGTPPFGHYSMVYPVNPQHFDGRDGQVYAAQGYAGPVAIPIAPIVNHTYNYGWGMPSSRLTPLSHPVSPAQAYGYSGVPGVPMP